MPTDPSAPYPRVKRGLGGHTGDYVILGKPPIRSITLARRPEPNGDTIIGSYVVIDSHAVIYLGAQIGDEAFIGTFASIRENAVIGRRCVIGTHTEISHDCIISDNVRIQSKCHLTGGTVIGEGTFLGPGVVTASDNDVAGLRDYVWDERHHAPPTIGRKVVIGCGAILLPGVKIGDGATIGAGSVVTKSVPAGETWMGNPARPRGSKPAYAPISRFDPECNLEVVGHPV